MNELAKGLNEVLDTSIAGAFLSQVGRRMYFPKGIVAQSDEAKQKADRYNATVGLATSKGQPMHLVDIMDFYKEGVFKPLGGMLGFIGFQPFLKQGRERGLVNNRTAGRIFHYNLSVSLQG